MQRRTLKSQLEFWIPPALMGLIYELKALGTYQKIAPLITKNQELKNIHKNDRCFIIGSGPSIKEQDLKPLKDEVVIPVNNFYVHPDFEIIMGGNCQKYYMTAPAHGPQDRETWTKWLAEISNNMPNSTIMLFGINNYPNNIYSILKEYNLFSNNKIYWYFPGINRYIEKYGFYSRYLDIERPIIKGSSAAVYALIFAVYMGFKEIYLIGLDHNHICAKYMDSLRFYEDAIHQKKEKPPKNMDILKKQGNIFYQYQIIKENTDSNIYNLSSQSLVDIFTKRNLYDVI